MQETAKMPAQSSGDRPPRRPLIDEELADQLLGRAQAEGAELLGPDGLLSQVTKAVLERALAEEMTGHLGYEKHDPAGRGSGNSRNGSTPKTLPLYSAALKRGPRTVASKHPPVHEPAPPVVTVARRIRPGAPGWAAASQTSTASV